MFSIPCVIFAGGKSSRMGEDKALLPFADFDTLTQYQYNRLSKLFSNVYISCKDKSKFHFPAAFIEDAKGLDIYAPTLGFVTAFKELKEERFFALSVDSPFVGEDEIQKLLLSNNTNVNAVIAQTQEGMQPLCGIYSRTLLPKFEKMLDENNHKLGLLLKNTNTTFVYFDNKNAFANLNHPNEYQEALKIISHC
ncbi:molybdenum cofactor guanylyltransferase MobA [Sulfurimonas sp.]|uniref:molybdenum cofactor guanylyltransferase MobA n=1 Tax=Sulfurimonas sp. TaxID=2022749 RepID=UPI002607D9EE|nr:molybdenum cofactor guanylyltransferase MobA [Sulfurimonas sp.]